MLGKIAIFRGKSFEKSFFNKFHGIFRGKSLSAEKNVRKIGPKLNILYPQPRVEIAKEKWKHVAKILVAL
jgi:hypothetical protein